MNENHLSVEHLKVVLDNAPIAIYVSELQTYKILYANPLAKDIILKKEGNETACCYQLAGFDKPCEFCRANKLSESELFVREFYHPTNQCMYQLSGKIINWAGKAAHIEYISDITAKKLEVDRAKALKEELQRVFSSIACGLCVYKADGAGIYPILHNPAFYDIMGYSEQHIAEVEQETNFLGVHPEDLDCLKRKVQNAIKQNSTLRHLYRLWNDKNDEYRWICLEGTVKPQVDGTKFIYCVYSDVTQQQRLEKELTDANEQMQNIINAIPGGVAVYKVSNIFETVYYSDGVPELSGYTVEEYKELIKRDAIEMTYWEDTEMVISNLRKAIQNHTVADFEFRKKHRDGHIVWIHVQAKQIGEEDGFPLIQCVFHNISEMKETYLEMNHLVNSIPGGIASFKIEKNRLVPSYFSDGVVALSGHTREEFTKIIQNNVINMVYEQDRARVQTAARAALESGDVLNISYRTQHKDGSLFWVHLNGRRMGPLSESTTLYAVFTGMSAETRLYRSIANESVDGLYIIDKDNYDLLYVNESKKLFTNGNFGLGQKCYKALHGKDAPCDFCTLKTHNPDGKEHDMLVDSPDRAYATRFRETDWNGVPSYIKFVRDITEEVYIRKEKQRLEEYFQTVVKNLPGGIGVVRYKKDGRMVPEYLSDGFAVMLGMTLQQAWDLYREDAMAGVHQDDRASLKKQMQKYINSGKDNYEAVYRLKKKTGDYIWVKTTFSIIRSQDGESRVYAVYRDMTEERREQERVRKQYNDLIVQHYRTPGPNALIIGHCNITKNKIIEIIDYTNTNPLGSFGSVREEFFTGVSTFIVDTEEQKKFLSLFLSAPALSAFKRNETERILKCYIKLPGETKGRYVQFKMNMVAAPDSSDITGILTVTDITEQVVSEKFLQQLSVTGYDYVIDLDLQNDQYTILSRKDNVFSNPPTQGCFSAWVDYMASDRVVPKDKLQYQKNLQPAFILARLQKEKAYTFAFSIEDDKGDIFTKNMTVSAIDLQLGRVGLSRTDITESIREQQGLLNMIAYTFDLAGFIDINSKKLTMYTRKTVLENLAPYFIENYNGAIERFIEQFVINKQDDKNIQLKLDTILARLKESPTGYEFLLPYRYGETERYKQVNVLWGDQNHKTVCLVRADVTDMLAAERESQTALENALALAEQANRAKSDFLSAMSHDIRTPMNAIMGMTTLAVTHIDEKERVADCLQKISVSSKHLLSLINDVLDMSKIEGAKIHLNRMQISVFELLDQLSTIMSPQAKDSGLQLTIRTKNISHAFFYGDHLRINQILINLLSNAVKFTPEGGQVDFLTEEIPARQSSKNVRYRFSVKDTGIGMSEDFLIHLFEPFVRSDSVAKIEGTGLGLSIIKGLVDLMGGEITVQSCLGEGSVFTVELECEKAENQDKILNNGTCYGMGLSEDKMLAGCCILVAEDNAINAEITCGILDMFGAKTVVKGDGEQAVHAFQAAKPGTFDAILMDIQMPKMNGYEATTVIRKMERPDAASIPIIAMTANAFAEDVQLSLDCGMTAHVSKPVDVQTLKTVLRKTIKS